jgi:hypothetical protein
VPSRGPLAQLAELRTFSPIPGLLTVMKATGLAAVKTLGMALLGGLVLIIGLFTAVSIGSCCSPTTERSPAAERLGVAGGPGRRGAREV